MKTIYILSGVLALCSAQAQAADSISAETTAKTTVERDADGKYHKKQVHTTEGVDAVGTSNKVETKVEVETDAKGNGEKVVTTETVTDPKGFMNKEKTTTKDVTKYEDGKLEKSFEKKINGKTVEKTADKM